MVQTVTIFTSASTDTAKFALCTDGNGSYSYLIHLTHPIGVSVEAIYPYYEFSYASDPAAFVSALKRKGGEVRFQPSQIISDSIGSNKVIELLGNGGPFTHRDF